MNSTNHTEHDLNARLSRHAEQFDRLGGADLDLGQVLDRAGEIKRGRRMRATMVMAACVLAIAVPTAIVAVGRGGDKEPQPAPPSQVDRSALTLGDLKTGAAPAIGYADQDSWHPALGSPQRWGVDGRIRAVARIGTGFVAGLVDDKGRQMAVVVAGQAGDSAPGSSRTVYDMTGGFATSGDGTMVAFVQPDGTPTVVADNGRQVRELPRIQRGSAFGAVAVDGQECRTTVELPCRVWVTSHGSSPESWTSTFGDIARKTQIPVQTVTDVDDTGTDAAGIVDVRDDLTTCSAVVHVADGSQRWATCDHRLVAFSPNADRLLATGSVGDGIGDTELAVLDESSGDVELDLKTMEQAFIAQMMWEDDDHVLASVFQAGRWAVLRIGMDGSREYALPPVPGEDLDAPFVLASH
jgi:hypothetical protein